MVQQAMHELRGWKQISICMDTTSTSHLSSSISSCVTSQPTARFKLTSSPPSQYIASDIPSNLLLKQFGSHWLAFLVIGFGVVSIGAAFVHSMAGLIATRVFLGLTEGGTLVRFENASAKDFEHTDEGTPTSYHSLLWSTLYPA